MSDKRFETICLTICTLALCATIASCQWAIVAGGSPDRKTPQSTEGVTP